MKSIRQLLFINIFLVVVTNNAFANQENSLSSEWMNEADSVSILLALGNDIEINQAITEGRRWASDEAQLRTMRAVLTQFKEYGVNPRREFAFSIDQITGIAALQTIKTLHPQANEEQIRRTLRIIRNKARSRLTSVEAVHAALQKMGAVNTAQLLSDAIQDPASKALIWNWLCADDNCSTMDEIFKVSKKQLIAGNQYWVNQHKLRRSINQQARAQRNFAEAQKIEARRTSKAAVHRFSVAKRTSGATKQENLRKAYSAVRQSEAAAAKAKAAVLKARQLVRQRNRQINSGNEQVRKSVIWSRWMERNRRAGGDQAGIRVRGLRLDDTDSSSNIDQRSLQSSIAPVFVYKSEMSTRQRQSENSAAYTSMAGQAASTGSVGGAIAGAITGAVTSSIPVNGTPPHPIAVGVSTLAGAAAGYNSDPTGFVNSLNAYLESQNINRSYVDPSEDRQHLSNHNDISKNAIDHTAAMEALSAVQKAEEDAKKNGTPVDIEKLNKELTDIHSRATVAKNYIDLAEDIPIEKTIATRQLAQTEYEAEKAALEAEAAREEQNKSASSDDGYPNANGSDSGTGGNAEGGNSNQSNNNEVDYGNGGWDGPGMADGNGPDDGSGADSGNADGTSGDGWE